jgi:hypothetical protein
MMARGWMQAGFVAAAGAGAFVFLLGSGKFLQDVLEEAAEGRPELVGLYVWLAAFGGAFAILDGLLKIWERRAVDLLAPATWSAMATMAAVGVIAMGWGERVPAEMWWLAITLGAGCYATVGLNLAFGRSEHRTFRSLCLLPPLIVGVVVALGIPGAEELKERGIERLPATWPSSGYILVSLGALGALAVSAGAAEYRTRGSIFGTTDLVAGAAWGAAALAVVGATRSSWQLYLWGNAWSATAVAGAALIFAAACAIRWVKHRARVRSHEQEAEAAPGMSRREMFFLLIYPVVVISGHIQFGTDPMPERVFDGTSKVLKTTAVVATLEDPMPAGKNVIWCSSFEMAWSELRTMVAKEPVRVQGAQALCGRLNATVCRPDDLVPGDAGTEVERGSEGLAERLARRFPGLPLPPPGSDDGLIVHAHLRASVAFETPYFENDGGLEFKDGSGRKTPVGSFGVRRRDAYAPLQRLRDQVEILYNSETSCAVDLCRSSHPYRIVVALTERGPTLGRTLAGLAKKIEEWKPEKEEERRLGVGMALLVPNMNWRIHHDFAELSGRAFTNPSLATKVLVAALQTIEFRLDRSGAQLRSHSGIKLAGGMRELIFDRPFLIYMKKRKGGEVFFSMWVENAELMEKK